MSKTSVRYDYGFNTSGTHQHEVIEYVFTQTSGNPELEEGPYVVLYTEEKCTAEVIARLLTIDGTDNNFPHTPLDMAKRYMAKRFRENAASSPPGPGMGE